MRAGAEHLPHPPTGGRLSGAGRASAPSASSSSPADTYSWIPFGGGIRRCLGASFALYEMKIVIPTILRNVDAARRRRPAGADPPAGDHVRAGADAMVRVERFTQRAAPAPWTRRPSQRSGAWPSQELAQARETVAVIGGTGALGFGLALRWAIAGVPIVIGSRERGAGRGDGRQAARARARSTARRTSTVEGLHNDEARQARGTVVLAVPFRTQSENLNNLRHSLEPGTVLVDATVPLAAAIGGRATRTVGVWQGSAAQQAEEMAPRGVTSSPPSTP